MPSCARRFRHLSDRTSTRHLPLQHRQRAEAVAARMHFKARRARLLWPAARSPCRPLRSASNHWTGADWPGSCVLKRSAASLRRRCRPQITLCSASSRWTGAATRATSALKRSAAWLMRLLRLSTATSGTHPRAAWAERCSSCRPACPLTAARSRVTAACPRSRPLRTGLSRRPPARCALTVNSKSMLKNPAWRGPSWRRHSGSCAPPCSAPRCSSGG